MPGNKSVYRDALKKGHNAAWDQQWQKAVTEYRRALAEFPNDASVRQGLAHALEESGQLESALREYQHLAEHQPHDPAPLTRIADVLVKMRRPGEAAATYMALAEMYVNHRLKSKEAIAAWNQAAELEPDRADVHQRLADMYEQSAQRALAAKEYLAMAQIYRKRGDKSKALDMAERAQKIDPSNTAARALIDELERVKETEAEAATGPIVQAEKEALARLAEMVLGEPAADAPGPQVERRLSPSRPTVDQHEIEALIARAVDAQTHRRVSDAIESYRKLLSIGITRSEIKFNLGLLYLDTLRYDDAVEFLNETVDNPDYGLASHFALGQCYRAQGKTDQAIEQFSRVTRAVDLASVQREQADDLISVYEELAECYATKGDRERAETYINALEKFLTDKGWEDQVHQVHLRLEALREGGPVSFAEAVGVPESNQVLEALALAQEYLRREKLWAAGEECLRAIGLAPNYIPGHVRLAEILTKAGRTEEAHGKYQILAGLCLARGDAAHAEVFYRSILKVSANDVGGRAKLIDLLIQQGRTDDALEQFLILGDEQAHAGDFSKAAEKFAEGVRIAARAKVGSPTALTLRHRLAEARTQQGDFKVALDAYQDIRQQFPDDERAHLSAVDLEFRLGQSSDALRDLEDLVKRYESRGEPGKATAVLEALAQSYPTEVGLLDRLARHYAAVGAQDQTIATLDKLGELYVSLGQKQAATATIQQILSMNPPRADGYQKLLKQIGE